MNKPDKSGIKSCLDLLESSQGVSASAGPSVILKRSAESMVEIRMCLMLYPILFAAKSKSSTISFYLDVMEFSTNYQISKLCEPFGKLHESVSNRKTHRFI